MDGAAVDSSNIFPVAGDTVIAAFDFDGTLSYCDTLLPFLRSVAGFGRFWGGMLASIPVLVAMKRGRIGNDAAKQAVLEKIIGGLDSTALDAAALRFVQGRLGPLIDPVALDRMLAHRAAGHRILLVSASPDLYLRPWAERYGIEAVLSTRLERRDGRYTGRFEGTNCYGAEKTARLAAHLGALEGREIYAYGDSRGDREMLAAARYPAYRRFHPGRRGVWRRFFWALR